jgi:NitT/TauT family transport system permease protein
MKKKLQIKLIQLLALAGILLIWQWAAAKTGNWPSPVMVLYGLGGMITDGSLLKHSVASLFRVTCGFYLAFSAAIPLAILLGRWPAGEKTLNGLVQFLRPISPLAWIPLAITWFGIGEPPAIFLIFIASFFPLLLPVIKAVQQIRTLYFQIAANLDFSLTDKLRYIIIPAIAPEIVTATRVALGVSWLVVVAAEMIAVKTGLGYLIIEARNTLRLDLVIAAMIVIGLIGLLLDHLVLRIERIRLLEWKIGAK